MALVPIAVAINVVIGRIVAELSLPLYLDATGTVLAAALAGPVAGVATGVLSQTIAGLLGGYVWLAFTPIQVLIALLAVAGARAAGFRSLGHSLALGAFVGLLAGVMSAAISYLVFRGVTAGGVTAITTILTGSGIPLGQSIVISSVLTDVVDKAIAFAVVGAALRGMPQRMAARFPDAQRATTP
jgi:energy-coupling factor transport system substrate-specific component